MRIENRLADAYKREAMDINSPKELDDRIMKMYEKQAHKERVVSMRTKKNRMMVFALVGVIALMITGFTVQYVMKLGDDRVSLEYSTVEISYDPALANVVRDQIQQVKEQLEVGEVAYAYSKEIAKLTPNISDDILYAEYVSKPYLFEDLEEWKKMLSDKKVRYKLPDTESENLFFKNGIEERAFGGLINQLDIASELQNDVKLSGGELAWKKIEPNHRVLHPVYTTLYEGDNQEIVSVMMELVLEETKIVSTTNVSQEKVSMNGLEAHYSETDKFIHSDTNHYQSLIWVETLDEMSMVYTIGSPSEDMTKERLISIAESMR
jgi:hypothetical protein